MPSTGRSTKLCVTFGEGCVVDFDHIFGRVSAAYEIGYAGIFESDGHMRMFIQTSCKAVRMSPTTVYGICGESAIVSDVSSFHKVWGKAIDERGSIRQTGRSKDKPKCINEHGEEDTSHITVEMLIEMVGTKEEALERMSAFYTTEAINHQVYNRWKILRQCQKDKKLRDNELQDSDFYVFDGYKFLANYSPTYYEDSDCEENTEIKDVLQEEFLLQANIIHQYVSVVDKFEKLLYENVMNSNVKASTSLGYFQYFQDSYWVSQRVSDYYLNTVIRNRVLTISTVVDRLGRNMSPFLAGQLNGMFRAYSKVLEAKQMQEQMVRQSIINAQNQTRKYKSTPLK